MKSMILKIV